MGGTNTTFSPQFLSPLCGFLPPAPIVYSAPRTHISLLANVAGSQLFGGLHSVHLIEYTHILMSLNTFSQVEILFQSFSHSLCFRVLLRMKDTYLLYICFLGKITRLLFGHFVKSLFFQKSSCLLLYCYIQGFLLSISFKIVVIKKSAA